ncbi:response regulator [Phyllobacterium sp. P30BS-XVII]|uniref:response regulator n=1 Tax=Phyllobacterium sp. P30BS-XVII TaxID=2587046 RepID=UPI0015FAAFA8|nr:response regulator [Phyllobacterium sp. P30BS-XVII]MBA8904165.1 DNA-binding response OmpR family regulator [Phyllobacterium sp. P30BS-XVII]
MADVSENIDKVLIIEDDYFYADNLRRHFKTSGKHAVTAETFSAAQSAIEKEEFDLIIIDPGLPDDERDMESREVRYSILESIISTTPAAVHLVITGRYSSDEAETCRELGAKGYLGKIRLNAPTLASVLELMTRSEFVMHRGNETISDALPGYNYPFLSLSEEECLQWVENRPKGMKRNELFGLMARHFKMKSPEMAEQKYKRARSKILAHGREMVNAKNNTNPEK